MSDYFGALMRSSGLAVGGGAAAVIAAQPASAAELVEIDIERSVPAMQPSPALTAQHQLQPLSPLAASVEPRSEREPEASAARLAAPRVNATAAVDTPHDQAGQIAEALSLPQPLVPPATPADPATPVTQPQPLGHARVRAAMQWVAADPQLLATPEPQNVAYHEPPTVLGETNIPIATTSMASTPLVDTEPQTLPARAWPSVASSIETVETVEAAPRRTTPSTIPTLPATPTPALAPLASTPLPRDELVEISIGAIHLRVDAPATQTVARALPPQASAPRSTTPTTPPRSALARRALRRI